MAPRKKSNTLSETEHKPASLSRKRKQLKKDDSNDSSGTKEKLKRKKINTPSEISNPDKDKVKPKHSLKKNKESSENVEMETQSISVDEMNVEQLLALGETSHKMDFNNCVVDDDFENSDSNVSDFEEVKTADVHEPIIPKDGVNITLEVPNLYNRQKKKGFDVEAHLKRQINRVRKDLQLLMHKVHVLCWIAHLRFVNNTLNNATVMKTCASLVKSKNLYPPKYASLSYLEEILKWFHKNVEYKKEVVDPSCTGGLFKELMYQIEKNQAYNYKAFVFIFIILLRVLGLKTRIVMSFQVLPVKPSLLELYGDEIKARSEKLKKAKEEQKAGTSKNKDISADPSVAIKEKGNESVCQKNSKRKSTNEQSTNDRKGTKTKRNTKKSGVKVECSEDESESEHFKSSKKARESVKFKQGKGIVEIKDKSKNQKSNKNLANVKSDEDEDSDFTEMSLKKKNIKRNSGRKSDVGIEDCQKKKEGFDVWTEVYLEAEEKWISVDVPKQKIHCVGEIYVRATHPVIYIVACNNDHTLKDVTKRYVPNWHSETRKKRVDEEWWNETMKPYLPAKTAQDKEEDEDINRQLIDKPLPSSIAEFKDHPLYALKRHLLKFEAIYPPDAPTLGFVRGEPVYARECVHVLHSREMWYKQARVVRLKEEPYKTVKARPKYDKMTGEVKKDLPLELFGKWQTEDYIPLVATGGKVPRNEYGNVDLFKPCMLPIGTVHLQIPALNRIAKKLDIDCAPATVGFDFHSGGSHPVFDGFVVCEEFKEILLDAWNKEIDESAKREAEKRDKRVYGNWKRLIRGLLIREKLKIKYAFGENSDEECDRNPVSAKTSNLKNK